MQAKNKTTENDLSVRDYLDRISDDNRRKDCSAIIKVISKATGFKPKMWGTGIVGFGSYHYQYDSGREGDAPLAGLSSRSNAIVLYMGGEEKSKELLLKKLGKHKRGKACIYIQRLEDVDAGVIAEMAAGSVKYLKSLYP